jgi:type I restriction enzyme M protein
MGLDMKEAKGASGANLGFEEKMWKAADKLRNNMDAAEYKHVVLGLVFLKYISDAFKEVHEELVNDPEKLSDPEEIDEYKMRNVSKDILGRVYKYFLGQFANAEGKKGGQFYTPRSIVQLLVAMIEPFKGRVFDPCCGSGGMFIQSEKFVQAHQRVNASSLVSLPLR